MPVGSFYGNRNPSYYDNFFTNRSFTPDILDTYAGDPAQRGFLGQMLREARFGENAKLGSGYSAYLNQNTGLLSALMGLQGQLGMQQNPKGNFETFVDFFNSQFGGPGGGTSLGQVRSDIFERLLGGGERARALEQGQTPGQARSNTLGLLNDALAILANQLPAEALSFIQNQGEDLYNKFSGNMQGRTDAPTFVQWLARNGWIPNQIGPGY